jgi:hypothetical protein
MTALRIIGDVHGQIHTDDLLPGQSRSYLDLIAGAAYSIQVGDMGDGESYALLLQHVDAAHHRFFPGNHDHYNQLPPDHCLGDFGVMSWGDVDFFFLRGAASVDKDILVRLGRQQGRTLWFAEEELTEERMQVAEQVYLRARPNIVLSHDAPTDIAWLAWSNARRFSPPNQKAVFQPSRTNAFLARLLELHPPRLWVFGHYHRDWRYLENKTLFVCVGELSYIDIEPGGKVRSA